MDGKVKCKIHARGHPAGHHLPPAGQRRAQPATAGAGATSTSPSRWRSPRNLNEEQKDALRKFAATMGEHSGVTKSEEKDEHSSIFHRKKKK